MPVCGSVRLADGSTRDTPPAELTADVVFSAVPWRAVRSYRGQQHLSGLYWSSTTPPVDGIRLGDLPGDDPDRVDPVRVHDAIATQPTPRDAAAEAGITLEQLRYTARTHPI